MSIAANTLTVAVQDWYANTAIADGSTKTFWVVARGNPKGAWDSVQLDFTKDLQCWQNSTTDSISVNTASVPIMSYKQGHSDYVFNVSGWFAPLRAGCLISGYFLSPDGTTPGSYENVTYDNTTTSLTVAIT